METIKTNNLGDKRDRKILYQQQMLTAGLKNDELSIKLETRVETKQQRKKKCKGFNHLLLNQSTKILILNTVY